MNKRTKTGQKKHDESVLRSAEWYKKYGLITSAGLPGWNKPKKIKEIKSKKEVNVSMVLSGGMLFSYAEAYLNAAKRLASMENREYRKGDWNIFAMPLLFLFRHYLELGLKACICMKKEIEILKAASRSYTSRERRLRVREMLYEKPKFTHDLPMLLNDMKKCFSNREYYFSENVQNYLTRLSKYDKKSEAFKYPFDTKGNLSLPEPIMSIDEIKKMIKETSCELNSIATQLIEDLYPLNTAFLNKIKR